MKRHFGFTLIELLVVITIITILAAILVPVIQKARTGAWAANCQSNIGQLGKAMDMYAIAFGGYFSWSSNSTWATEPGGSGHFDWNQVEYTGYTGGDRTDAYASFTVDWTELYTPYTEDAIIFRDPAIRRQPDYCYTQVGMTAERRNSFNSHYEMNWFVMAANQNQVKFGDSTVTLQCGRFGYDTSWFYMPNWSFSVKLGDSISPTLGSFAKSTDGGPNIKPTGGSKDWTTDLHLEGLERSKLVHGTTNHFLFVDTHVAPMTPEVPGRDWFFASAERHWSLNRTDLEEGK